MKIKDIKSDFLDCVFGDYDNIACGEYSAITTSSASNACTDATNKPKVYCSKIGRTIKTIHNEVKDTHEAQMAEFEKAIQRWIKLRSHKQNKTFNANSEDWQSELEQLAKFDPLKNKTSKSS